MEKYHKIQTIFKRDPETKYKTLLWGEFSKPEFEYLADKEWIFTEKIHGMNMRVHFDIETKEVTIGGRTDRAQIPQDLIDKINELFPAEEFANLFDCSVTLYGEGYGAGIQKGGNLYSPEKSFILFDVMMYGRYSEWGEVENIADELGCDIVPVIGKGTLWDALELAKEKYNSVVAVEEYEAEGFVCRLPTELYNRYGERVIAKIKSKDFV